MVNKNQVIIGGVIGALVVAVVILAIAYYSVRISGTGTIKTVGVKVYADEGLTKEISSVDWGAIPPGGTSAVTFWIKSTSTVPINLTLTTDVWNPPQAQQYLTLSWDYNNSTMQPNAVIVTDLTLKVSPQVSGITTFSFDMVITASG